MPRLCQIHFAGIGHRDARLAPLTLDLRNDNQPSDAVVWLRNGGGKSSVLNLFFSTFRPNLHEFLGRSVDGQSRHLSDYVKAADTAFVVTEWEIEGDNQGLLLGEPDTRIVGQVMQWRGQQRSSDSSRLQRTFFTLRTDANLRWADLPVHGIASDPVTSMEEFTAWLDERHRERPAREVTRVDNQSQWARHLEAIRLDPELFKYQLQMNRREGAADELFRFASTRRFVEFFLELTLDPQRADQVAMSLSDFRDTIAQLPARRLERDFANEARRALGPLAQAAEDRQRAGEEASAAMDAAARLAGGLRARAAAVGVERDETLATIEQRRDEAREASNRVDRFSRWVGGLERRAVHLDHSEAEAEAATAEARHRSARGHLQRLEACGPYRELRKRELRRDDLRQQLAAEEAEREPLRRRLSQRGAELWTALGRAIDDMEGRITLVDAQIETTSRAIAEARSQRESALKAKIGAERDRDDARARLAERDRERERCIDAGFVELRETAVHAAERWASRIERGQSRLSELGERIRDLREREATLNEEAQRVAVEHAERQVALQQAVATFREAREERDAIEAEDLVGDTEEVLEPDVFASGLEGRLRERALATDAQRLRYLVDGAEDERASAAFETTNLLPPSRDVERVVERLKDAGIAAFSGYAYLADNVDDAAKKRRLLRSDPARFAGVLVAPEHLARAGAIENLGDGLRGPVTVAAHTLDAGEHDQMVVGPEGDGVFHYAAAASAYEEIEARTQRRERRVRELRERADALRRLADRVQRFVGAWGDGRFDDARERADALGRDVERLARRIAETGRSLAACRTELTDTRTAVDAEELEQRRCERAQREVATLLERFEQHVERWREAVDDAEARIRASDEAAEAAKVGEREANERRDAQREEHARLRARRTDLANERDAIGHRGESDTEVDLDTARRRYRADEAAYEQQLGDSRIRGQLDEVEEDLPRLQRAFDKARGDVAVEAIANLAAQAGERLEALVDEARAGEHAAALDLRQANAAVDTARAAVEALTRRRRTSDDLPTDEPPPETAGACRERADALRKDAETARTEANLIDQELRELDVRQTLLQRRIDRLRAGEQRVSEACDVEATGATELPEDDEAIEARIVTCIGRVKTAREALVETREAVRRAVERVRAVALDERFAEHDSHWKQQLMDEEDALTRSAAAWDAGLRERIDALDDMIEKVERDREGIVIALLAVAEEALRLLGTAEKASRLPPQLGRWAGQPFLRVSLAVPASAEERRALLGPLVDELVESGQVPGGLELAERAVERMHGSRPMRADILKPEAARRLDRVDVASMVNFSGGERLTAAVLLYCTLVNLRARRRGRRGNGATNVLILDNPIGTCSSVPLIELQREVARAMNTQLVYTTGVDDLAALAQLPTVVRLRNVHRSVSTGDLHVTLEEGVVDGVRIARREDREAR